MIALHIAQPWIWTLAGGRRHDETAPQLNASLSGTLGQNGWYQDATLNATGSDALSGLDGLCPAPFTFGDGENQVTVSLDAGDDGPKTVTVALSIEQFRWLKQAISNQRQVWDILVQLQQLTAQYALQNIPGPPRRKQLSKKRLGLN